MLKPNFEKADGLGIRLNYLYVLQICTDCFITFYPSHSAGHFSIFDECRHSKPHKIKRRRGLFRGQSIFKIANRFFIA